MANLAPDLLIEGCLKDLGIDCLCEWDVLVFLYRHQTTLVGTDHLASLLGYDTEPVVAALDVLEALNLLERSRLSKGARLYQFKVPPTNSAGTPSPRGAAFERLLALTAHRAGRLVLAEHFGRCDRSPPGGLQPDGIVPEKGTLIAPTKPGDN